MKHYLLALSIACTLISCGTPSRVGRAEIPPPNIPHQYARPAQNELYQNEEATQDFLQLQIDRSSDVKPPVEPEIRVIERVIYGEGWGGSEGRQYRDARRRSSFPFGMAFGAGLGAIIGHQSDHRGRGAAIGAGLGLLLDFVY